MAEGLSTPLKGRNEDVELLFKKMGEKLGWFQHKDIDTALKSLTKSSKKKGSSRSRVRSEDVGNKENQGEKGVANKNGDAKNELTKERTKRTKKKVCKAVTENSASQESGDGYPLKASKACTDLTREIKKKKKSSKALESNEPKTESSQRLSGGNSENSDVFPEMPSLLEDLGAPLVESTRIHSRESLSLYRLQDSFMSSESCDSSVAHDQSSFNKLEGRPSDGARYFRTDKTLIRIRNSLSANELKKKQLDSSTENYYSVVGESITEEEKEEYYSVLEESPVGSEPVKCKSEHEAGSNKESEDEESRRIPQTQTRINQSQETQASGLLQEDADTEPVQGDKPMVGEQCSVDLGMRHREVSDAGTDESEGSYYEVEDAYVQTDLDDGKVGQGVKVIDSGSSDEGGNSDSDFGDGDAATVINNNLGVTDLCERLKQLQHGSSLDDGGGSSVERESEDGSEKEDDVICELSPSDSEGKVLTRQHVRHISDSGSPGESEGSFYEVADQCVQTDVHGSQTEDDADVVTPHAQPAVRADGACTSPYFPPSSCQVESQPRLLKTSNSGTPTLAELKSATYEKLRMSVKRFNNTPQSSQSGRLMDSVLKKINLFGSNTGNSSLKVSSVKDGNKIESEKDVKPPTDDLDRKLSKCDRMEVKLADGDRRDDTTEDTVARRSFTERHFSDIIISGQNNSTSSRRDDSRSTSSESFHEGQQEAQDKTVKHKDRMENIVENLKQMSFGSKGVWKEDNCVRDMPVETPSRRLKLSLKKSRPVTKVSSSSSCSMDEHPGRKELYQTGYSSPDYSAESPKRLNNHSRVTSKCSTSKENCKSSFTVPDSPPLRDAGLNEQANKELFSGGETGVPDSQPPVNENRLALQSNEENLFPDEGEEAVPDSPAPEKKEIRFHEKNGKVPISDRGSACVSDSDSDEFHSIHVSETSQITKSNKSDTRKTQLKEEISSDSSSEDYDMLVERAKERKGKRVMEKKSVSQSPDDSLPDLDASPDQDDRYCITVGNATAWRSSRDSGKSSDEEEDLENFFKKMKSQKTTKKTKVSSETSDSDSMKEFINDDSIVSSGSEDDVFYLKVDNSQKEKRPPRIPEYVTSSDEESDETDEDDLSYHDSDETDDDSDEEEEYRPRTSRKQETKGKAKTPLPKIVHRKYETPKAQVVSSSRIPSSAECSVTSSASRVKTCSFLQSLTANLPDHRRHPEASTYVKQFKKYKMELTQRLYKLYNQTVFDKKLSSSLEIGWNKRLLKTAGYCKYMKGHMAKVELSDKVCDSAERVRDTLIHELCHAASWILNHKNDGHGPYWKYWARKANQTCPDIPVITRCHDYAITTKYTYQCVKCGYSIGRHSKSLDTDRKVCGKCYGRFEVRLSKNSASSSVSNLPKTPRTPNRFALFVKEQYGTYKKNKDLKHKDIMQLLSQEFAAKNKLTA